MKRGLVYVLALLLVPVLVFSSPQLATAATAYGQPASASFGYHPAFPANDIDCGIAGYFAVSGNNVSVQVTGDCKRQLLSDYEDLSLTASDPDGSCVFLSDYENDSEGGFEMTMTPSALVGALKPADFPSCQVTEGCAFFIDPDSRDRIERCFTWPLGTPPVAEASAGCTAGVVVGKPVAVEPARLVQRQSGPILYSAHKQRWKVSVTTPAGGTANTYTYTAYRTPADAEGGIKTAYADSYGVFYNAQTGVLNAAPGATSEVVVDLWLSQETSGTSTAGKVIGFEVFAGVGSGNYRQPHPYGKAGITDAAKCQFWFGPKIVDDTTITTDEPIAPLDGGASTAPTTPPTATPPPEADDSSDSCGADVSLRDPSSWASGATCLLLKGLGAIADVLGDLLSAVLGLADDLLGGLKDLFELLFVPDVSSWDVEGLREQVDSKPPFSIATGLGDGVQAAAKSYTGSGCGGLANLGDLASISCNDVRSSGGMAALYRLVQFGLVTLTGIGVFMQLRATVEAGS